MHLQRAWTLSCFLFTALALSDPAAALDGSWLAAPQVPRDAVTAALNEVWGLPPEQAATRAVKLQTLLPTASAEGRQAAGLLIAAALERSGDPEAARVHHEKLAGAGPYAMTASFRRRWIEDTGDAPEDDEAAYEAIAAEPMAEGWFLFSEGWVWSTRQQAAQALIELREDRLSFRFFQLLAGLSPIQGPYGYLVVLLALALGVKVLELPLLARTAKFSVRMRPRLEALLRLRESDPEAAQQQLVELYQREGGGTMSGCALSLVDLIFVVWAFVTLSQFSPQLVLHGARFLWAPDVTRFDFGVVVVWVLVMLAHSLANQQAMRQMGQTAAQMIVGALVFGSILAALAHHWEWPAYIFVFWAILATLSLVIGKTFVAVSEATA